MQIGRRRHRIELQVATDVQSMYGDTAQTWATSKTRWASITPLGAGEQREASRAVQDATHEVNIRYESGITSDMRVKWGSRYFEITGITNTDEANRELVLVCVERTAG